MVSAFPRSGSASRRQRHRRRRVHRDLLLVGLILLIPLAGEVDWRVFWNQIALTQSELVAMAAVAGVVALLGALFPSRLAFYLWHGLANALAEKQPQLVAAPRVVDGDTIDDVASGVRYRFANIDAPETGDNARCHRERVRGEGATAFVERALRKAETVSVRRTFRHDIYGRRVAFVLVDGQDLGEMLVQAGFAQPWRGRRVKWCGPQGGLAKISETGGFAHACRACGANQPVAPAQ